MTAQEAAERIDALILGVPSVLSDYERECLAVLRDAAQNAEAERDEARTMVETTRNTLAHTRAERDVAEARFRGQHDTIQSQMDRADDAGARIVRLEAALHDVRAWIAQEEEAGVFVPTLVYAILDDVLAEVSGPPEQAA